ncbi:MAG: HAMP domain-containing protein [Deltaproteobacteria bacterium]|nr:HAMP domain-containing protein [Deltaproteobacteria bacterium]
MKKKKRTPATDVATSEHQEMITREYSRRKREKFIIVASCLVLAVLLYLETRVSDLGPVLQANNGIILFALININTLLLLLLIFLVLRNVFKLMMDRRHRIPGVNLRTKLAVVFIGLSLLPTILLLFVSIQFIASGIEFWFSSQVETSLNYSLELSKSFYASESARAEKAGIEISRAILTDIDILAQNLDLLESYLKAKRNSFELTAISIYSSDGHLMASSGEGTFVPIAKGDVTKAGKDMGNLSLSQATAQGDLLRAVVPVVRKDSTGQSHVLFVLVAGCLIDHHQLSKMKSIAQGLVDYRQLSMLKKPFKTTYYMILSIISLLIVFSATWFGFYLAKGLTEPIKELAEGTKRIAEGDYDVYITASSSEDELSTLIQSFNKMTGDLKQSKSALEATNKELVRINDEIEQRRRYTEIILNNAAAGVISMDDNGKITTINKSAGQMLNLKSDKVLNQIYTKVLPKEFAETVAELSVGANLMAEGFLERQVRVNVTQGVLTLLVHLTMLKDEEDKHLGMVLVFDDMTHIEKVQRMVAWREVARRIAHEIKNPLTPIKLSAQRLQKKYGDRFGEDGKVFDECTRMIVNQVDELRHLVNEFSKFAKMPAVNPTPNDLVALIKETFLMYQESPDQIKFSLEVESEIPVFNLDWDQVKRALINILDNAVAAVGPGGQITVRAEYDPVLSMARVEIADNGPGIPATDRIKVFEPYFSTKKSGTGLGLTIVNAIISDHNGFVRVNANEPHGAKFVIELPLRT